MHVKTWARTLLFRIGRKWPRSSRVRSSCWEMEMNASQLLQAQLVSHTNLESSSKAKNHADLVIRWSQRLPTSSSQSIAFHPGRGRAVIILGPYLRSQLRRRSQQCLPSVLREDTQFLESQTYTATMPSAVLVREENKAEIQSPFLFWGKSMVKKVSIEDNGTLHRSAPAAAILLNRLDICETKRGASLVAMHKGECTRQEQSTNAREGSAARRGREETMMWLAR